MVEERNCLDRKKERCTNYLSLQNTTCLKGILSICILICHLWGPLIEGNPSLGDGIIGNTVGRICAVLGYLSVALFLFLSGYGLFVQYQKQGEDYLDGFLLKRVVPLYLINVILIGFYLFANVLLGEEISLGIVIQSFFFGKTIVSKGWYIQSILLWYLFFFVVFKFIRKDKFKIVGIVGAFILYLMICLIMKLPSTWYECAGCLMLGILWAKYLEQINHFLSRKKWLGLSILLCGSLFITSFIFGNFSFLPNPVRIAVKSISACAFAVVAVLFLRIIPINNVFTRFLGQISLEIYVFHGFFLTLYRCKWIYINSGILYIALIFISSIGLAFAVHPLFSIILRLGRKEKKKSGNENEIRLFGCKI